MNTKKWLSITASIAVMTLLLTKYQNCAPAPNPGVSASVENGDGEMRIVDDWAQSKLTFIDQVLELHSDTQDVTIDGLCARAGDGQSIGWAVVDQNSGKEVVHSGDSVCEGGGFRLQASNLQDMNCGEDYQVKAETGAGDTDVLTIKRNCAPLRYSEIYASGNEMCYLELQTVTFQLSNVCYETCYVSNKQVAKQKLPSNECSDLQASN